MQRGFTLIELLIVIAIIGILSSIVLASLNSGRSKANDSSIKENLANLRSQAALIYDNSRNECYSNTTTGCSLSATGPSSCPSLYTSLNSMFGDSVVQSQIDSSVVYGGGLSSCALSANAKNYAVTVQLKTDLALAWCVDSSGVSKQVGTPGGASLGAVTIGNLIIGGKCN